jgi:hypothetical protein
VVQGQGTGGHDDQGTGMGIDLSPGQDPELKQQAFAAAGKALGAVIRALFLKAADEGLDDLVGKDKGSRKESWLTLYRAAIRVAAENPKLFVNDGGKPEDQLIRDLFQDMLDVLKDLPPPFTESDAAALAGVALEAVGSNAHRFADKDNPWQQAAADAAGTLMAKLSAARSRTTRSCSTCSPEGYWSIWDARRSRKSRRPRR